MQNISLRANAKLNLFLKINGITNFGYHDMTMINQSISLYDDIKITKNDNQGIKIIDKTTDIKFKENIMYKTAKIINDQISKIDVDIEINKKIPMQAGLGGGSSDAAAIITGLDHIYNLNLSDEQKIDIAVKVGADVPFCLFGATKYVAGIGEKINDVKSDNFLFIIIKPDDNMPTNQAFMLYDNSEKIKRSAEFLKGIKNIDLDLIRKNFYNDFEPVISDKFSVIEKIKSNFYKIGASFTMMSGSGTTVYAIFDEEKTRQRAYDYLKNEYKNIFLSNTTKSGIEIVSCS